MPRRFADEELAWKMTDAARTPIDVADFTIARRVDEMLSSRRSMSARLKEACLAENAPKILRVGDISGRYFDDSRPLTIPERWPVWPMPQEIADVCQTRQA